MQVTEKYQRSLRRELLDQLLSTINCRVKDLRGVLPPSVQIAASKWASVISVDHTIRVKHGNNFEDKVVSEVLSLFCIADQEVNHTFHHPTAIWFAWMHSCTYDDSFLLGSWIAIIWSGCDSQVVASVTSQGTTQNVSRDIVQFLLLYLLDVVHQIRIGVRLGVSKEDGIIIVLKVVREGEGVIASLIVRHLLPPIVVLEITYVFPGAVPTELLLLKFLLRISQDFHAFVEETLRFH